MGSIQGLRAASSVFLDAVFSDLTRRATSPSNVRVARTEGLPCIRTLVTGSLTSCWSSKLVDLVAWSTALRKRAWRSSQCCSSLLQFLHATKAELKTQRTSSRWICKVRKFSEKWKSNKKTTTRKTKGNWVVTYGRRKVSYIMDGVVQLDPGERTPEIRTAYVTNDRRE